MYMLFHTMCLVITGCFVQSLLKRSYTGLGLFFISGKRGIGTKLFLTMSYLEVY